MNTNTEVTTDFNVITTYMRHYAEEVVVTGSTEAARGLAARAKAVHKDFSWGLLAKSIVERKGDVFQQMSDHARKCTQEVNSALSMSGPNAQQHVGAMELSPIALTVGQARTYTGVTSAEQLQQILQTEPSLVEALKRHGKVLVAVKAVRAAITAAPTYLVNEIFNMQVSTKYTKQEGKMKVTSGSETRIVKASAFADLEALSHENNINVFHLLGGMNRVVQSSLKLAHWYAESSVFWLEVPEAKMPVIPEGEDDNGYAGGEDTSWSSPLQTYQFDGQAGRLQQWQEKEDAKPQMAEDFAQASQDAEALLEAIAQAMEDIGLEIIYAWHVIDADAGNFMPITCQFEAEEMLLERSKKAIEKRAANAMGIDQGLMEQFGLVAATLGTFTKEEAEQLTALRKELGHE
tara:strand:- start:277 stop:1491 length:1215 start_codon:yes stop_codon:yes gene_type:complete